MAVEEESFEGIPPDENREIWDDAEYKFWTNFQTECKEWRDAREAKYSRETTDLRVQLSELSGKRNAIHETYTRLRAQLAQTEDELSDVSQRLAAKESEFGSLNDVHRIDVETKHKEWEHQMRVMTNFFREKRGDQPLPDDATIEPPEFMAPPKLLPEYRARPLPIAPSPPRGQSFEPPPPPSTTSAAAAAPAAPAAPEAPEAPAAPKSAPPSEPSHEEILAREALAQSALAPSPAKPSPPRAPQATHPTPNGHWDIPQNQEQRRPDASTSSPRVEDAQSRVVRDLETRQREEREKREWERRDQEIRERDIQEQVRERERRDREAVREREIAPDPLTPIPMLMLMLMLILMLIFMLILMLTLMLILMSMPTRISMLPNPRILTI
ncbi:uncharacterized protein J7T54_004238 [Emericellopsis cladophorae]|uniref:Uncharacterized protein n=1 Tax=Emericellopsis cladophorae TaxID=2686198 RepID=A0A9P9XYS4_9HYPO|nr:uncharacterized protein J7T54_004238 [Emericellopsis cladophorae]KAI6780106.1 hypothetical protein J7T54_004238 [Emericellopsis cladophorae]